MMSDPIVRVQADMPDAVVRIEVANQGKDGYTPKRGVDYWTEEDVQEIHNYVDEQIGASPYAVSSVNGKTGSVVLAPEDIGAQPKGDYALKKELPSVPTHLSQFEQDADHRLTTDAEKDAWNAKSDFSGKYADLEGKPDIPTVPENVSAFENDVGYLTEHQDLSQYAKKSDIPDTSAFITRAVNDLANYYRKSETYTQHEIDNRISTIPKFSISVVSFLPTQDISDTTIYLVSSDNDVDLYTEYIHVNGAWETLGSQRADLTDYATQTWTLERLAGYQPKGEYLTKVPDEYVTEADIDAKGYLTEHQDLSDYALKEEVPQIDDAVVSAESTWSSKNTVERFLPEFTESGAAVECHPFPLCPMNVSTTFEPAQTGSGDPYPAGGGKNLLPFPYYRMNATSEGVTYTASGDGGITASGTSTGYSALSLYEGTALSEGVYTLSLSGDYENLYISIEFYDGNWNHKATLQHEAFVTFSTDDYSYPNWKILFKRSRDGVTVSGTGYPQLELGSTVTSYAPYSNIRPISGYDSLELTQADKTGNKNIYAVQLGQIVYGGTYDWSKGELVAEWAMREFDGTEAWAEILSTEIGRFFLLLEGYGIGNHPIISDRYMTVFDFEAHKIKPYTVCMTRYENWATARISITTKHSSLDDFKSYLAAQYAAGTPVQVAYKLAEPITIRLAPSEIMPLEGMNVLISNPGDTTVSGKLDPIYLHDENKAAAAKLADMETRLRALESAAVNNA